MNSINIIIGEKANIQYASSIIGKLNFFFKLKNRELPNFYLSFHNTKEVDMLGVLLIYKLLEYSVSENCFITPRIFLPKHIKQEMKFYGFHDLISELMTGNDTIKEFENLKLDVKKDFFIAPIALIKGTNQSSKILNQKYYPQISEYYGYESISLMIFQLFTELYSNFSSHALDETKSIMVAHGNHNRIEIACADTGIGIITSMKNTYNTKSDFDIVRNAVSKGITSKPDTNHMGYGLWYVDEVVKRLNGKLHIITSNTYYKRLGNKVWLSHSSFWQGTIIYLDIPVTQPILISNLENNNPTHYLRFV